MIAKAEGVRLHPASRPSHRRESAPASLGKTHVRSMRVSARFAIGQLLRQCRLAAQLSPATGSERSAVGNWPRCGRKIPLRGQRGELGVDRECHSAPLPAAGRQSLTARPASIAASMRSRQPVIDSPFVLPATSIAAGFQAVAKFVKVGEVDKSELPPITNVAACD